MIKRINYFLLGVLVVLTVAAIGRQTSIFNSIALKNSTGAVGQVLYVADGDGNIGYTPAAGGSATNAIGAINGQTNNIQIITHGGTNITSATNGTGTTTFTVTNVISALRGTGTSNTLATPTITSPAVSAATITNQVNTGYIQKNGVGEGVAYWNSQERLISVTGVTEDELTYLDGVTSAIQTQFGLTITNFTITRIATTNLTNNLTAGLSANGRVLNITNSNATNFFGPIVAAGSNVTVTPTTNAFGMITYTVASTGGGGSANTFDPSMFSTNSDGITLGQPDTGLLEMPTNRIIIIGSGISGPTMTLQPDVGNTRDNLLVNNSSGVGVSYIRKDGTIETDVGFKDTSKSDGLASFSSGSLVSSGVTEAQITNAFTNFTLIETGLRTFTTLITNDLTLTISNTIPTKMIGTSYTATSNDCYIVYTNTTNATITLPVFVRTNNPANEYRIASHAPNGTNLTIAVDGAAGILGASTYILSNKYQSVITAPVGTNWIIW